MDIDWSGDIFYRGVTGVLYYGCDDGGGDENDAEVAGGRFVAFLAEFGYFACGYGEAAVTQ
jgi:hypothetical protein